MIFTFDGDAAGQRAAQRAFGMEEKFVTQTFVTVEPNGLDPCDLRLAHGDGAVRDLIARRVPLFEFAIKGVLGHHNLNTTEGQLAALDEAAPIVAKIKDQGLRTRYAVNLDRWLGLMDERFVLARVRAHAGDTGPARRRPGQDRRQGNRGAQPGSFGTNGDGPGNGGSPYDLGDPVVVVEREALKLAVQRPALCGPEFDALGADAFTAPVHRAMFTLIAACGGTASGGGSPRQWTAQLREQAPNERAQAFVTALAVESLLSRAGREVRRRATGPGGPARGQPGDHLGQGPAAAHESGGRAVQLQQDVRGSGGTGETQESAARAGRRRLKRHRPLRLCSH